MTQTAPKPNLFKEYLQMKRQPKRNKKTTMSEIIDIWLETKKDVVKKSTYAYYRRTCNKVIRPFWSEYTARDISSNITKEFLGELTGKYSPKTQKDISVIANQILKFAYNEGYINFLQPMSVKSPKRKSIPVVFSLTEQKRLTAFLLDDIDLSKVGILLSLYSGIRLGELCGLQWNDVDMAEKTICIRRTIQRIEDGFCIDTPKTVYSERILPIPHFVFEILQKYENENKMCYVVSGNENFVKPRTYQSRFKRYLKQCNLPDYHFHTLRHTFATRAIELGFDPKSLSEILGHANTKITLDLYVHPSIEAKQEQMNRFACII